MPRSTKTSASSSPATVKQETTEVTVASLSLQPAKHECKEEDEYAWHMVNAHQQQVPQQMAGPQCRCGADGILFYVQPDNPNGNAGRPYFKCADCQRFLFFCDARGNDPTNPACFCGNSSKRQVTGVNKPRPGRLFYVCRLKNCDYYEVCTDEGGNDVCISMDPVTLASLAKQNFI
ncbi:hypothetical protein GGR50DRAFT_208068 [Xylaria sp. CBS 124048]|nr:hypothetical protein GGR50DRAFT_208068 [Xylaria sp. CBS 124048]